jgi:hypothetical protein
VLKVQSEKLVGKCESKRWKVEMAEKSVISVIGDWESVMEEAGRGREMQNDD